VHPGRDKHDITLHGAGVTGMLTGTARHALNLVRPLMAVPGPITSDQSAGCHTIIKGWQGTLITSTADVIETLAGPGPGVPSAAAADAADMA
jgi:DNA processing protein